MGLRNMVDAVMTAGVMTQTDLDVGLEQYAHSSANRGKGMTVEKTGAAKGGRGTSVFASIPLRGPQQTRLDAGGID